METPDTGSLEEFFEKVGTKKKETKGFRLKQQRLAEQSEPTSAKDEDKDQHGKIVQYSHFMSGYMPCSSTIKALPSGCYRIKASQQGLWLDPADIVTDSLIQFPDTKSDSVIAEIERFWELKKKFQEFGFAHKRGFLLWGPPGSGKTCTVAIVIQKMVEKGGLVLIADHPAALSGILSQLRSAEPNREIVVIWEDLDAVIERFGESEVLSVLDGESQVDNIVFIATTNYPEQLDARITNRPSRFDRIEKIDMPNDLARQMYLETKVGSTKSPCGIDLVEETKGMSIAHLRELIVGVWCQGNKASEVLARLKRMKIKPNSAHSGQPIGLTFEVTSAS